MSVAQYTANRRTRWQRYALGFFLLAALAGLAVVAAHWLIPVLAAALVGSAGAFLSGMAITASVFMCVVLASLCAALAVLVYDFFDRMHVPMDRWHSWKNNPQTDSSLAQIAKFYSQILKGSKLLGSLKVFKETTSSTEHEKTCFNSIAADDFSYLAGIHDRLPAFQHAPWWVAVLRNRMLGQEGLGASGMPNSKVDFDGPLNNPSQQLIALLYLSALGLLKPESNTERYQYAGFTNQEKIKSLSPEVFEKASAFVAAQPSLHVQLMMCCLWQAWDLPDRWIGDTQCYQVAKYIHKDEGTLDEQFKKQVVIKDWQSFTELYCQHFGVDDDKLKLIQEQFQCYRADTISTFSLEGSPRRKFGRLQVHEHGGARVADPVEGRLAGGGEASDNKPTRGVVQPSATNVSRRWLWLLAVLLGLAAVLLAIYLPLPVSAGTLSHILFSQRCWILAQSALFAVGVAFAWDAWRQPKATSAGEALLTQRQAALLLAAVVLSVVVLAVVFAAPAPVLAGSFGLFLTHNTSLLMASTVVSAVLLGAWTVEKCAGTVRCDVGSQAQHCPVPVREGGSECARRDDGCNTDGESSHQPHDRVPCDGESEEEQGGPVPVYEGSSESSRSDDGRNTGGESSHRPHDRVPCDGGSDEEQGGPVTVCEGSSESSRSDDGRNTGGESSQQPHESVPWLEESEEEQGEPGEADVPRYRGGGCLIF